MAARHLSRSLRCAAPYPRWPDVPRPRSYAWAWVLQKRVPCGTSCGQLCQAHRRRLISSASRLQRRVWCPACPRYVSREGPPTSHPRFMGYPCNGCRLLGRRPSMRRLQGLLVAPCRTMPIIRGQKKSTSPFGHGASSFTDYADSPSCATRVSTNSAWLNSHTPRPSLRAFGNRPRASQFDTCLRVVRKPARSVSQSAASAGEHSITASAASSNRPATSMSKSKRSPHSGHQPSRMPCGTANDAEQSGHCTTVTLPSEGVHNRSIRRNNRSSRSANSPAEGDSTTLDHDLQTARYAERHPSTGNSIHFRLMQPANRSIKHAASSYTSNQCTDNGNPAEPPREPRPRSPMWALRSASARSSGMVLARLAVCRRMCLAQFLQRGVCASVPHCWHLFMRGPASG